MSTQDATPGGAGSSSPPQRSPRPRELQDALNFHLYHPLSWALALRLARTPITPNMVSIMGGLCVVAAAFAYSVPGWPLPALAGLLLHMSWHVVDGADGDLARLTGRNGPLGELVDGICDYASHVVLYIALTLVLEVQIGALAWLAAAIAGASHIVQSNYFEVQRRQYQWWAYGTPWLRNAQRAGFTGKAPFSALGSAYLALANSLAPKTSRIDTAIEDAAATPVKLAQVRAAIRSGARWFLPRFHLLSNNHRTITLGLSMLAGSPLYYFIYEATVLNIVLVRSMLRFNSAAIRLSEEFDHLSPASTLR